MSKKTFTQSPLYRKKEPRFPALRYLKHKSSFWIAALSLVAFVAGNMIGQHGMYAFWASVLGEFDDSLLTYTGAVAPLKYVPDYTCWSRYGGDVEKQHTYRELPENCRVPLPAYDITTTSPGSSAAQTTYSVAYMGGYDSNLEGEGSHLGVDIRVPIGTPVYAVMDGIVTQVREDKGGYGLLVVIRHRAPDPSNPSTFIELDSVYGHLSAQLVTEGQLVSKGTQIALSGVTGNATGPHLHFQIDRKAPWHPYWPFTSAEIRDAGLSFTQAINTGFHQNIAYQYTVDPLDYLQKHAPGTSLVAAASSSAAAVSSAMPAETARQRSNRLRAERVAKLVARRKATDAIDATQAAANLRLSGVAGLTTDTTITPPASSSVASVAPKVVPTDVSIQVESEFSDSQPKTVTVMLLDEHGNRVTDPQVKTPLHIMTAFGDATFSPSELASSDFHDGAATVQVTPVGKRTIVIKVWQFPSTSRPMKYVGG